MILIVGATGVIGGATVRELARDGAKVRALTRSPDRWEPLPGVEVAAGDLDRPETLPPVLDGVESVFIATSGHLKAAQDARLVEAARRAGVRRLVTVSSLAVDENPDGLLGGWHAEGERVALDSGIPITVLRPNGFYSNTFAWAPAIAAGGELSLALPDLPAAHLDPRDIGRTAAAVLRADYSGAPIVRLSGPRALTPREQVGIIAAELGIPLTVREISIEAERERLARRVPEHVATAVTAARAAAGPVRGQIFDDVEKLTGTAPIGFEEFVHTHRARFLPS
ncbi:NAD(P)H-binding protein [Nocardia sp. AG03]|uniref:SDR family oxidoreductase n=1 Tax=Nocardia sp. AG03 TaxID=3025312 RepID=UPI00241832B0|nr:NAD(P)H-binding protein [Nocardia sp. AG03]